jgi:hypothetical protein
LSVSKNKKIESPGEKDNKTTSSTPETTASKTEDSTLKVEGAIKEKGVNVTELKENVTVTEVFVKNENLTDNKNDTKETG